MNSVGFSEKQKNIQKTNLLNCTVNMEEIVKLVQLLHQNGDKVLSASCKLSLSTELLYNLNEAFSSIIDEPEDLETSFQVCNSSKINIFSDLKFLYDFIQKTVGLKVTYCVDNPDIPVNITKFRHLKYLELKKINIELVKGLQEFTSQLESIICVGRKGISSVSQLLASCGEGASIGCVWDSLKHLTLSYNSLEKLDKSLELAPWLQLIDLSHNLITSADELSYLPNLKYVNLGYNKLETVPTFNKAASYSLQVLVLKNNYIEKLNGLQNLKCLTKLDLSYNCLMEHSTLWVLEKMSTLLCISLEGNPLSYHLKHRQLFIKYLHPSLKDSKFVLDHLPLSRSEKQIIAGNRYYAIRSEKSASSEFSVSVSDSLNSSSLSASMSTSTFNEFVAEKSMNNLERNLPRSKKKLYVKEAIIAEDEQKQKELKENYSVCSSYSETSKDHLETKKQILALRNKFGEDEWLNNYAGTIVQDITGLQSLPEFDSTYTMLDTQDSEIRFLKNVETAAIEDSGRYSVTENNESNGAMGEQIEISTEEQNVSESLSSNDTTIALVNISDPPYDLEEEKGDLYLVHKKKQDSDELEELFLIITLDDIKERDSITGKLKYCWSTSSVLSCVRGRSEPVTVDIIFDTKRETRQNRRYFVNSDDAKKIVTTISERIKKRPISLKVFKCMKCSTHFSQDTEYVAVISTSASGLKQLKCPTCESTLVIETDELSTVDPESDASEGSTEYSSTNQYPENTTKTNLQHSESFSSIGGTEGRAISVTTSLVHSDSHTQAQVCCSATSLDESRESTPSTNTNKKYESDIEILSNPSQSSIEVLDDASREDPQRWLHKEISWTIDRLRSFAPLPYKQGILIELEQSNKLSQELQPVITFLCILQDFQRTYNFLFYTTELSLPPSCKVEFTVPEHCTSLMHTLLKDCTNFQEGDTVRLLALFSSALLKYQGLEVQLKLSSLIVTASVLVICNIQWLLPGNKEAPQIIRKQPMSNLIGIEHYRSSLTLNFLDEVEEQKDSWILNFISVNAAETVINSIQPPWEELFSIPLQITTCKTETT
ncbi:serine/threonine-protein kinase 11-interacting protein isoform X4 [Colletes gigas]|uniref:serine/threonine-protein kinase 11-interacting protein isoform X4 n=1 Tax=Colletes gigas TaxID=935657 RepID=UPI001C9AEEFE|nr:serine/threonine-protein kinase 11-interacting protein isoform X4 [Colletes gigas]